MSSECFNALLMPQEPIEAGTDYTEKEVNKLFTTQRGCSVSSLHRLKGSEAFGHWAADGKRSLELPSSGSRNVCGASITGNHVCCHYQLLSETDAPRSISVSDIKELLWRYTDFWTKQRNYFKLLGLVKIPWLSLFCFVFVFPFWGSGFITIKGTESPLCPK